MESQENLNDRVLEEMLNAETEKVIEEQKEVQEEQKDEETIVEEQIETAEEKEINPVDPSFIKQISTGLTAGYNLGVPWMHNMFMNAKIKNAELIPVHVIAKTTAEKETLKQNMTAYKTLEACFNKLVERAFVKMELTEDSEIYLALMGIASITFTAVVVAEKEVPQKKNKGDNFEISENQEVKKTENRGRKKKIENE